MPSATPRPISNPEPIVFAGAVLFALWFVACVAALVAGVAIASRRWPVKP